MTRFRKALKSITNTAFFAVSQRKAAAVLVMLGIMMPTAAPIPLWAADLNLPPITDDGLRLTASESPLERSMRDLLKSLTSGPASLFAASSDDKTGSEALAAGAALEKQVAGIRTELGQRQEIEVGQIISLGARPLDKKGEIVNGVGAKWQCANSKIVRILNDSQAIALTAGEAKLSVHSGSVVKEITVLVKKNVRDAEAQANVMNQDPETPVYTDEQTANMVTPENNLGNPVGQSEIGSRAAASAIMTRERYGSSNFSFDIPAASLAGRGIDASIGLTYNSRVWNKSGSGQTATYNFNIDGNWIAPGFEMGYGEMVPYGWGSVGGYMLTSPSGTRHQLAYKQASGGCSIYESNDGTFIRTTICGHYIQSSVNVIFPDGTQVMYGTSTSSGKRFPIRINDRNGNMMTIAYVQGDSQGKILYIKDTLNRYINFYYEATGDKKLVAITVPGFDGGAERQTIRFYYADMSFDWQGRFDGIVAPQTVSVKVLKYVYFPGTQTGFKYDYSPTFGMIYKIWQLRGMVVDSTSTTETGGVTNEGTWAAWTNYNYPTTQVPTLTDVPKYTERTDDWKGRTSAIPQTGFMVAEDVTPANCVISSGVCSGTRTVTVTAPDGTRNISVSKIEPTSNWENGLLKETRIETGPVGSVKVWSKTSLFWEQGADSQMAGRDNPRLDKIEVTNDAGQTRATSFDYDNYNNQTVVREHDFAAPGSLGTELRRTETTYENGNGWIVNRLLHLPKEVKTIVGGQAVSKTAYEYDNNGLDLLVRRGDISNSAHDRRYNPNTPPRTGCFRNCDPLVIDCCWEVPLYAEETLFRGNVTKITAFSDATLAADPNASVSTMKYDITGNVTESSSSCCELKTTQYVVANQYAFPMSQTRSGQGLSMTTSATYDVNTGLIKTATDENNQTTTLTYSSASLRQTRMDGPVGSGIWTTVDYNDATWPYHVKTTQSLDVNRSVSTWDFSNGAGQQFRSRALTSAGYLSSEVEFDIMGGEVKTYNPYTVPGLTDNVPAGVEFTEVVQRDGLGRPTQVKLQDGTSVYSYFNEEMVTVAYPAPDSSQVVGIASRSKDQANKEHRRIIDSLGRVIRVDEPTTNGLGPVAAPNQPTFYKYDGNNNLAKAIQSDGANTQERMFKYDALSRLTHEKQVEANATLNDAGSYVGASGSWTGFYKHDTESMLEYGVDANGVRTTYSYDGLHRVKNVTYSGESGYETPSVTYNYDETENGFFNNGRLTGMYTAANAAQGTPATAQNYRYDKIGRVTKHVQTIGSQTYQLEYGYDLAGNLIFEKYPSGKVINMTIDNFGRLSGIADTQRTFLSGVTVNTQGLLSQISLGNGTSETFSYNDRLQMNSQTLLKGSEVLQKYDYSYGTVDLATGSVNPNLNNGKLGKIDSWIGTNKQWSQSFDYDPLGRLKEIREYKQGDNAQLTYKQVFDFDRFGNLYRKEQNNPTSGQENPLPYTPIEEGHISKLTNRLTIGTTYDDAGRVVTDGKFRSMGFEYDANGRQVKALRTTLPDAWSVYDALGNRVGTKINNVWQYVIYDAFGNVVAEYGMPPEGPGGVKHAQQDWQGSVRTLTNTNGFVVGRTDHQPFGEEIGYSVGLRNIDQGYSVSKVARQNYGLTERDDATGMGHAWFRKNESLGCRWTSPDPYSGSIEVDLPQSLNRYSYVSNDPINFVDPSGLQQQNCYWKYVIPFTCSPGEGGECGWDLEHAGWAYICESTTGGGGGGLGGGGGGGGGAGPRTNPQLAQPKADPCANKKGPLDFTKRMGSHIFPRHIANTTFRGKSKYTFLPWQRSKGQYESQVGSFGQTTFENGKFITAGNNVVYTYAFFGIDVGDGWVFREIGRDGKTKEATNVNTIVVSGKDCKTVITAHPGLPWQFDRSDIPGAIFRSGGFSTQHLSQF